jgi:BirA family biotin operon repressor/biotin-[acetyl-CoA-carboxylase] ligase
MEKMRAEGFVFEGIRRRGYKLVRAPEELHPWLFQARLRLRKTPEILWRESIDSTNSEAERELAAGRSAPFIVLARKQTAGRGRLGRRWHSEDAGNLYASFAFRPNLEPTQLQTFTLWMGLNVCDCVRNACRIQPMVKWPNDILYHDRKLGGMLTEARIDADQTRDLIFGLGLNVNTDTRLWPEDIQTRATSLRDASGGALDLNHLAAAASSRILAAYDRFVAGEHRESFAEMWRRHDALFERDVTVVVSGKALRGRALGIDEAGALRLRTEDARVVSLRAGEVTIGRISTQ